MKYRPVGRRHHGNSFPYIEIFRHVFSKDWHWWETSSQENIHWSPEMCLLIDRAMTQRGQVESKRMKELYFFLNAYLLKSDLTVCKSSGIHRLRPKSICHNKYLSFPMAHHSHIFVSEQRTLEYNEWKIGQFSVEGDEMGYLRKRVPYSFFSSFDKGFRIPSLCQVFFWALDTWQ